MKRALRLSRRTPPAGEFIIQNTPPVMGLVSIDPASPVYADTLLHCDASGTDIDQESTSISYVWTKANGSVLGTSPSLQLTPDIIGVNEEVICNANISDESDASDAGT